MHRGPLFLPTLGGWLAMLNFCAWSLLIAVGQCSLLPEIGQTSTLLSQWCLLILGFPLLWMVDSFVPLGLGMAAPMLVILVVLINSYVWGCGIEFVFRLIAFNFRRAKTIVEILAAR